MAVGKHIARKLRLLKAGRASRGAPAWAILKKFGKRRSNRWRLNPHMRRHWRSSKLKK